MKIVKFDKLIVKGLFSKKEYIIEMQSFKINHIYFEFNTIHKDTDVWIHNVMKNRWFQKIITYPIAEEQS